MSKRNLTKISSFGTLEDDTLAIKILVVGDVAVGKTSIIQKYVYMAFDEHYQTTLGVDFALKKVLVKQTNVKVQLWDVAGQERFIGLSHAYYKDAAAAIVVFDILNSKSLENAKKWKQDLDDNVFLENGDNVPTVLFANKSDLIKEDQTRNRGKTNNFENLSIYQGFDKFCKENYFDAWYMTSAKTGDNIKDGMDYIINKCMKYYKIIDISCDGNRRNSLRENDLIRAMTVEADPSLMDKKKGCCQIL